MRYNELWRKLYDKVYPEGEAKAVTRMLLTDKYGMTTADMLCEEIETFTDADTLTADIEALMAFTPVRRLGREQRRRELARLTGGSHVSQTMLDGAEELLTQAEAFRAGL